MKIALLHYRYVPAIAGVELVLEAHARLLTDLGHEVTVLAGSGSSRDERVRVAIVPELTPDHPLRAAAQQELDALLPPRPSPFQSPPPSGSLASISPETATATAFSDSPPSALPSFQALTTATQTSLRPWLETADQVIVHNVLTMPFHLACTAALWRLADELPPGRIINWVHDLAAANPDYALPGAGKIQPWALLGMRHTAMRVVAISDWRARAFRELTGTPADAVIPNGIDPCGLLALTPRIATFVGENRLLEADLLLLQPARILRRKNIELGLHLVAELKNRGCRAKLLVTGAPDGHNPDSARYHQELLQLRESLGVTGEALLVSEFFPVTKADLVALYQLSDILWFPSRQEGFGLPVLEGALHRLPVFCADVPPMNSFELPNAEFFDPDAPVSEIAGNLLRILEKRSAFFQARRTVIRRFAWDAIRPLLQAFLEKKPPSPPISTPRSSHPPALP